MAVERSERFAGLLALDAPALVYTSGIRPLAPFTYLDAATFGRAIASLIQDGGNSPGTCPFVRTPAFARSASLRHGSINRAFMISATLFNPAQTSW